MGSSGEHVEPLKSLGYKLEKKDLKLNRVNCPGLTPKSDVITMVANKMQAVPGSIIAVDSNFICYAVRGGKIRVIHQDSGRMELVKNLHEEAIEELKLVQAGTRAGVCHLMSISSDAFAISRLEFVDEAVLYTNLCHLRNLSEKCHASWHPFKSGHFVLGMGNSLITADINGRPTFPDIESLILAPGTRRIKCPERITGVVYSEDESVLAVGTDKGTVLIYENNETAGLILIKDFEVLSEGLVENLFFMGEIDLSNSANTCLLAVSSNAKDYRLIDLNDGNILRMLQFSEPEIRSHRCFNDQIFVSNNSENNILSIHVQAPSLSLSFNASMFKRTLDIVKHSSNPMSNDQVGFDHVNAVSVNEPVVDFSVLVEDDDKFSIYAVQTKSIKHHKMSRQLLYSKDHVKKSQLLPPSRTCSPVKTLSDVARKKSGSSIDVLEMLMKEQSANDTRTQISNSSSAGIRSTASASSNSIMNGISSSISSSIKSGVTPDTTVSNTSSNTNNATQRAIPGNSSITPSATFEHSATSSTSKAAVDLNSNFDIQQLEDRIVHRLFQELKQNEAEKRVHDTSAIKTALDANVKSMNDKIESCLKSSGFQQSVATCLGPAVEVMLKDVFTNVFVPGMDRAVKEMFAQVNATLEEGLKQHLQSAVSPDKVKHLSQLLQSTAESVDKLVTVDALQAHFDQFTHKFIAEMNLKKNVQDNYLNAEIKKGSMSSILSPVVNTEAEVKFELTRLLDAQDYETAFVKALGSGDLQMVLYVCSKTKPKAVFLPDGPLISQPVILSLIHQLGLDLHKNTMFKTAWLQDALMNLKKDDPEIAQHCPKVLKMTKKRVDECCLKVENDAALHKMCRMVGFVVSGMISD